MSLEMLENKLYLFSGKTVTLVRPMFGSQSDSWSGKLIAYLDSIPVKFQVQTNEQCILFTCHDVKATELRDDVLIIRLKGPLDYVEDHQHA